MTDTQQHDNLNTPQSTKKRGHTGSDCSTLSRWYFHHVTLHSNLNIKSKKWVMQGQELYIAYWQWKYIWTLFTWENKRWPEHPALIMMDLASVFPFHWVITLTRHHQQTLGAFRHYRLLWDAMPGAIFRGTFTTEHYIATCSIIRICWWMLPSLALEALLMESERFFWCVFLGPKVKVFQDFIRRSSWYILVSDQSTSFWTISQGSHDWSHNGCKVEWRPLTGSLQWLSYIELCSAV